MKQKLVFLLANTNAGGTQNFTLRFFKYLNSLSGELIEIELITFFDDNGDLSDQFMSQVKSIHRIPVGKARPLQWIKFYQFFKEKKTDLFCSMVGNFGAIPLMIAKMAGVKSTVGFYRSANYPFKTSAFNILYIKSLELILRSFSDKILANSYRALDFFQSKRNKDSNKFKVFPNGIDLTMFDGLPQKELIRKRYSFGKNDFLVLMVGRLDPIKNHSTMLEVAKSLKMYPSIKFVLVGKDTKRIETNKEMLELKCSVKALGLVENVAEVYKMADIIYLPSISESQPNALIEGVIAGKPFISSDIESIREIIPSEYQDRLFSPLEVKRVVDEILKIKANYLNEIQRISLLQKDFKLKYDGDIVFASLWNHIKLDLIEN